jgi:signal peptidase II
MQKTRREGSALTSPRAWVRFLAVIAAGTAADLASKAAAFHALWPAGTRPEANPSLLLPKFLPLVDLVGQCNHGAVFGNFAHQTSLLMIFTALALGLLFWLFADSRREQWPLHLCLALVVAGAAGNLYDRFAFSYVRDFIRFNVEAGWVRWGAEGNHLLWPYVFNVADVFITVGVAGLFIIWLASGFHPRPAKEE